MSDDVVDNAAADDRAHLAQATSDLARARVALLAARMKRDAANARVDRCDSELTQAQKRFDRYADAVARHIAAGRLTEP